MTTIELTRRNVLAASAALAGIAAAPRAFAQVAGGPRPFRMTVPQAKLDRVRQQILLARTAAQTPDPDPGSHGMTSTWIEALRQRWLSGYDWRAAEAEFNRHPQFTTEVDGQTLHFFHVRGKGPNPKPVLLAHGWPYSNLTFVPFLDRLTDPARFGGDPATALTIVAPANPGTAFSGKPDRILTPKEVAGLYHKLMVEQLGYRRFGLQGGDHGCVITPALAAAHPEAVIGLHLNLVPTIPLPDAQQSADERAWSAAGAKFMAAEMDYFRAQMDKPQMVGATLAASPMATAVWIAEKFWSWTDHGGDLDSVISKDRLLTEIMAYVATDTIESSVWFYRSFQNAPFYPDHRVAVPTGVYLADKEFIIGVPPRAAMERTYNLTHETHVRRGMHFPMLEQPDAFASDIRSFFAGIKA